MEESLTPAMRQYYEMKENCKDAILFFRMGDFYEMFGDDAQIAHNVLWVALTTRNKNAKDPIALAWIPYHAKDKYLPKLVQAGYKVAISEQVSDPKLKGIVKREIVRIVTPATLHIEMDDEQEIKNNCILSIVSLDGNSFWMSSINTSTNVWTTSEFINFTQMEKQVYRLFPSEVILDSALYEDAHIRELLSKKFGLNMYFLKPVKEPKRSLLDHFGVKNLVWYGIEEKPLAQKAAALILEYLQSVQKNDLPFINTLKFESYSGMVDMDDSTLRSLDILYNFFTKSWKEGTLFWVLAKTKTAMGTRLLRESLVKPLYDIDQIQARQRVIEELLKDTILLSQMQEHLKYIADMDTILTRLALWRATPRDMLSLKRSLWAILTIKKLIQDSGNTTLCSLFSE